MKATAALPSNGRASKSAAGAPQRYPVKITVFCDDRTGMLKELTAVISDENTNIRGVEIRHERARAKPSSSSWWTRKTCATSTVWSWACAEFPACEQC